MNREQIAAEIYAHQKSIEVLEQSLMDIDSSMENNQYTDQKNAEYSITKRFEGIAQKQCEGAYNCGDEQFQQRYQITGNPNVFEATVKFEYNRHDKTYDYIEGTTYSYVELQPATA